MKRLAVAVVLAALASMVWWLRPSDERRIGRALDRLERACSKAGPDSALALLDKTGTILDSFAPGFIVSAQPYEGSISDARQLAGIIHRYRASVDRVEVRDTGRQIEVGDGTAEMTVDFVLDSRRGRSGLGGPGRESFRAQIFWVRIEDDWKIRELEITERIDRPGLPF